MKKLIFAAALIGTAAVAQQPDASVPDAAVATTQVRETVVDDGSPPERDARGIPVISAPAAAPTGANQPVTAPAGAQVVAAPNQSAVFATQPSTKEYPVCSRTVTDGCVQAYERGRSR